jgi:hypothetical protein
MAAGPFLFVDLVIFFYFSVVKKGSKDKFGVSKIEEIRK